MGALAGFHFLRPWWLLAAMPFVFLAATRILRRPAPGSWQGTIAPHLLPHVVTSPAGSRWRSPEVVLAPLGLLFAVATAGPSYRLAQTPQGLDDTTLLIVVDLSSSMAGRDVAPSRIGRLRLKLRDVLELRRGARVGLLAVAGSAHIVLPPTDDVGALVPYVDVLAPDLLPADGERFASAAPLIAELAADERGPTVALVAADAIPPGDVDALLALRERGVHLIAWAVGTDAGRPGEGLPGLDRAGFERLARGGADVVDLSVGTRDLRQIDSAIRRTRTASVDATDATLWDDAGYTLVPLLALAALLWFRRGWVLGRPITTALCVLLLGSCADRGSGSVWLDLWWTKNQQARRLFDAGRYAAAAERFDDPMWKGIAYYTAHDWKNAQSQFERLDSVAALFNLGNAHAQARELPSAIQAYDQVLEREPTHRGARENRDYLEDVLGGLEQTTDTEELARPPEQPADPSKVRFRPDQLQGADDPAAALAQRERSSEAELSPTESDQWLRRVSTTPAEFLRAKFAIQAARGERR
jgi:Ca-activated chloride channel family protein